jgi:hypothetical protein
MRISQRCVLLTEWLMNASCDRPIGSGLQRIIGDGRQPMARLQQLPGISAKGLQPNGPCMPWIEIVLLVIITTPMGLAIHELGHFAAALFQGLDVVSFQAGPLLIDWRGGKRSFRFRPLLWLSAGAVHVTIPVGTPVRKRIVLAAAGPTASLLFSAIYWTAPLADIEVMDDMDLLQWFVTLLAASSFVIFILTAVPLRAVPWNYRGGPTDGYRVLTLIRSANAK